MSIPHVCPVCLGRGKVPFGFYDIFTDRGASSIEYELCRTCFGTGIIWGPPSTGHFDDIKIAKDGWQMGLD